MDKAEWKEKFEKRLKELRYEHSTEAINMVHLNIHDDEYYKKLEKLNNKFLNDEEVENPEDIEIFVNNEIIPRKMSVVDYKGE